MEIIYETLFLYFILLCINLVLLGLAFIGLYVIENPYELWEKIEDFINLITKPINF